MKIDVKSYCIKEDEKMRLLSVLNKLKVIRIQSVTSVYTNNTKNNIQRFEYWEVDLSVSGKKIV